VAIQFHTVSGHGDKEKRNKNDLYDTPTAITHAILKKEEFPGTVIEPCAGNGFMVNAVKQFGLPVRSNELYPTEKFSPDTNLNYVTDDLSSLFTGDDTYSVVGNPPYTLAKEFIEKTINSNVVKHAWLLRFQFVESKKRYEFFKIHPPRRVWIFSSRVNFDPVSPNGGLICFSWWVWERGFKGDPELKWLAPEKFKGDNDE